MKGTNNPLAKDVKRLKAEVAALKAQLKSAETVLKEAGVDGEQANGVTSERLDQLVKDWTSVSYWMLMSFCI